MSDPKSTLNKVMEVLGLVAAEDTSAVELAEGDPVAPEVPAAEAPVEEAPKASVEEMIAALDAKISALADMVASLVTEEATEPAEEAPVAPEVPMLAAQNLSAQEAPAFNGAPVEEKVSLANLSHNKPEGTLGAVMKRFPKN